MSWLARSLANSLRLDDDDGDGNDGDIEPTAEDLENDIATSSKLSNNNNNYEEPQSSQHLLEDQQEPDPHSRGVKEDLTELKQTLTRQLWGVASFLAPVSSSQSDDGPSFSVSNRPDLSDRSLSGDEEGPEGDEVDGGFEEIGGGLPPHMAVNHFPSESRVDEEETVSEEEMEEFSAVGITDEVLAFARNIAHHPETWLDFPLEAEDDLDDFKMSDAQLKHAFAIENLAPRLAALRIELCPCHMNDSYFWKVYFVLLHSRLNKNDAEILSTPQVMEARATWMKELQKMTKADPDWGVSSPSYLRDSSNIFREHYSFETMSPRTPRTDGGFETTSPRTYVSEPTSSMATDCETEKHLLESTEVQFIDKPVVEENPVSNCVVKDVRPKISIPTFEDDTDYVWPEDEESDMGKCNSTTFFVGIEDDFSFSDLEEEDDVVRRPMKP